VEALEKTGAVVWLTGLSGSGKTTVAQALAEVLIRAGQSVYVLDGDRLRTGLNSDLGFSPEDRAENIRRAGEVAALFAEAGLIAIAAFISPYRAGRDAARRAAGAQRFFEVFLDTPIEECERRDPKGLYRRARAGDIPDFTGISAPYERPLDPDLHVKDCSVDETVERIFRLLQPNE
jgi:adenylyl-sulfate kinase